MFPPSHLIIQLIFTLCKFKRSTQSGLVFLFLMVSPGYAVQPNWVLSGTFLDAENAHAMFVDENGDELLLELGDDIQGCDLVDVLRDLAKLSCNNKEYSMQLRSSVGDVILQAEYEQALENSATIVLSKSEVSEYLNEKQKLVSEIGFLPVMEDEQVVGFTLSKIKPDTKAASLGLYNGDVVKAVNGVPATDPEFLQTVQELSDMPEINVQIDRNGQFMAYTYILD